LLALALLSLTLFFLRRWWRSATPSAVQIALAMIEKLIQFETGIVSNVVKLENAPASQPSLADRMKTVNG